MWGSGFVRGSLILLVLVVPTAASAQWQATAGAQSRDKGVQAMAYLPNELWIHAGDSVQWALPTDEIHTITFLKPGQMRPPFPVGCPPPASGVQPSGSSYNGSACVNSGTLAGGATYSVTFPSKGNFKLVCLVHTNMTGVVHVLDSLATLPHSQGFYDNEAADQARDILADQDNQSREVERGEHSKDFSGQSPNTVIAGIGEVVATGGGQSNRAVMRFLSRTIRIHVGDTVEWTNMDPVTPHTVTFGTEPANLMALVNVAPDADGAMSGTINANGDSLNSGFLIEAPQERIGLAQPPPGVTRLRVKFTHEGTYSYICGLHDELGMKGEVVVVK